jgi:hypothetical protein
MMSENYFREIVDEVLREESREEGFQILLIGSQNRGEWEKYLKDAVDNYVQGVEEGEDSSKYNIVCMALDFAKYHLVNANLMEQKPSDSFGAIDWMFNLGSSDNDDTEKD